ncbi:MAG: ATPase, T2SS/T4P/T4SS family [Elusimicrobiota bacterium]|jgi:type IV pilus assembly protein PilB
MKGPGGMDKLMGELDALMGASPEAAPAGADPFAAIEREAAAAPPAPLAPPAPAAGAALARAARVLVLDDKKDYREVVEFLLSGSGYDVTTAEDGLRGLEAARRERPDLILLDFNMPGLNGYEVLQELRKDDELRSAAVIMFTGAPHRRHLKEMGMDVEDFLEKPVSNARLLEAVARALARKHPEGFAAPSLPAAGPSAAGPSREAPPAAPPSASGAMRAEKGPRFDDQRAAPQELPPLPFPSAEADEASVPQEPPASAEASPAPVEETPAPALEPPERPAVPAQRNGRSPMIVIPAVTTPGAASPFGGHPHEGHGVRARAADDAEAMPQLEDLEREDLAESGELLVDIEKAEKKTEDLRALEEIDENSPLVKRLNRILVRAVEMGASDIHIEPQENDLVVRVRLNGSLERLTVLPGSLGARVSARVKIMSELSITERRLPQDGQFRATINGKKTEFRVSTLPSAYGEKIVMRVLGGTKIKKSLEELGLSAENSQLIERALLTPHGLILVTGPTGSGKTTTLYTMIGMVNQSDVNVMTAEDPIEYRLPGITQVHVQAGVGLTFESVLRAFLRQDPDIMLVGEIRDLETAEIAVKASITGHLVLSTLHTNSAPATITRLTHMGLPPYLVAASVKLVIAQRLVKTLCPDCRQEATLAPEEARVLSEAERARLGKVFVGAGCARCHQTGYVGRRPVFEVMAVRSPEMRQVILTEGSYDRITAQAVKEGMVSLREATLALVAEGETSLAEALKIILAE